MDRARVTYCFALPRELRALLKRYVTYRNNNAFLLELFARILDTVYAANYDIVEKYYDDVFKRFKMQVRVNTLTASRFGEYRLVLYIPAMTIGGASRKSQWYYDPLMFDTVPDEVVKHAAESVMKFTKGVRVTGRVEYTNWLLGKHHLDYRLVPYLDRLVLTRTNESIF